MSTVSRLFIQLLKNLRAAGTAALRQSTGAVIRLRAPIPRRRVHDTAEIGMSSGCKPDNRTCFDLPLTGPLQASAGSSELTQMRE